MWTRHLRPLAALAVAGLPSVGCADPDPLIGNWHVEGHADLKLHVTEGDQRSTLLGTGTLYVAYPEPVGTQRCKMYFQIEPEGDHEYHVSGNPHGCHYGWTAGMDCTLKDDDQRFACRTRNDAWTYRREPDP